MNNLKGYIAVLLLTLFAVTTVPKEFYHDCGHSHTEKSNLQKDEIHEGDCPICDYTFSSSTQVKGETQGGIMLLFTGYVNLKQQVTSFPSREIPSLRGPPTS